MIFLALSLRQGYAHEGLGWLYKKGHSLDQNPQLAFQVRSHGHGVLLWEQI